jgi:hypothetical protein
MLNADDLLSPDNVAPQMQTARQITDGRTPTKRKFIPTPLRADLAPIEWLTRKREEKLHMQAATWLASRELTEAAGLWDSRLLEGDDGEYFFRVIHASNGIRFVPQSRITASPNEPPESRAPNMHRIWSIPRTLPIFRTMVSTCRRGAAIDRVTREDRSPTRFHSNWKSGTQKRQKSRRHGRAPFEA